MYVLFHLQMEAGDNEKEIKESYYCVPLFLHVAPPERSIFSFSGDLGMIAAS